MRFLKRVIDRLTGDGPWVHERDFDRKYSIQTGGFVLLETAHASDVDYVEHGTHYQATPSSELKRMLKRLPLGPKQLTFIDYGCGFGRTLFAAHELGFRRLVGIEYSAHFHERLLENLKSPHLSPEERARISTFRGDARHYELPEAEDAVAYLFNPFDRSVLEGVAERLVSSFDANPRALFVVYYHPLVRDLFDNHPRFRLLDEGGGCWTWARRWRFEHAIYQVVAR